MGGKKRDASIDILRGIATILVVIGHIPYTPTVLRAWIYTFHVPLFFFCSGLLFSTVRYSGFKEFFISRVKGLLLPIFSLGILMRLLQVALSGLLSLLPGAAPGYAITFDPGHLILSLLLGYRVHEYYYSLWFLYALFLGELIFFFISKLLKKRWYFYLVLMILGMAVQYWICGFAQGFIWSIDLLPACLAFLSAGYLYRIVLYEKKRKIQAYYIPVFFALSVLMTVLNYQNGEQVNLFYDYIGNPIFYLVGALAGILLCAALSDLIRKSRVLEFYGRNSLVTYAFQNTFAIPLMMEILRYMGMASPLFLDDTFRWIFTVTGTLLLSAAISAAVNRFAPFLLGRKMRRKEKAEV